jgi:hypothetical protein
LIAFERGVQHAVHNNGNRPIIRAPDVASVPDCPIRAVPLTEVIHDQVADVFPGVECIIAMLVDGVIV